MKKKKRDTRGGRGWHPEGGIELIFCRVDGTLGGQAGRGRPRKERTEGKKKKKKSEEIIISVQGVGRNRHNGEGVTCC